MTHPALPSLDEHSRHRLAAAGESASHLERVSRYSALLAEALDADAELVGPASRLHDIGRLATPRAILSNPAPLSRRERALLAEHAELGYALLGGTGSPVLDCAANIAWTHHERVDGSGYPRGLRDDAIPCEGRIVAVADVFDALICDRPHRPAVTIDEALLVLRAEPLDAAVVDALLDRIDEIREIVAAFPDEPLELADDPSESVALHVAATTLGVSVSRLRRWADAGRIRCTRTTGGHRRFPVSEVQRLAREEGKAAALRPVDPPAVALPRLAVLLSDNGEQMINALAAALYRDGPSGWFARPESAPARTEWLGELERCARTGAYRDAVAATEALLRRARLQAAGLLERYRFVEQFGVIAMRALHRDGADKPELAATRQLFVALAQAHLSES